MRAKYKMNIIKCWWLEIANVYYACLWTLKRNANVIVESKFERGGATFMFRISFTRERLLIFVVSSSLINEEYWIGLS